MKVLFLPIPDLDHPSYEAIVKTVGEQFDGIDVVVDANGAAGVKLWQVCTNGLDHVDVAYIVSKEIPFAIPLDNKPPCRSRSM